MKIGADTVIDYRKISMSVRPARVAVLIPNNDPYWKFVVLRVMEWCSKVWGGGYFIIIPTDGNSIDENFWKILLDYDPDHVYSFQPSFLDLENSNSLEFTQNYDENVQRFKETFSEMSDEEIRNRIRSGFSQLNRMEFNISKELQEKIKLEIAPFHFEDNIVSPFIYADSSIGYPLTSLETIIRYGFLEKIYVLDSIENIDCALTIYSNWGMFNKSYCEKIEKQGIQIEHIPENILLADLLSMGIKNRISEGYIKIRKSLPDTGEWLPDEDITQFTPFKTSLAYLQKYFINEGPEYYNEPSVLVLGDTIQDFCLYYSMSRFYQDVYWLPKIVPSKKSKDRIAEENKVLGFAVLDAISDSKSRRSGAKVMLTSFSLTESELTSAKKLLSRQLFIPSDSASDHWFISKDPFKVRKSPLRLIEENNYTNQYTEVFANNQSIGLVPTPKPKNFGKIAPYDHRWITEINIDGYVPPRLYFLGKSIINISNLSTESRVGKTGICYNCPNIGYFGGDIDVTLVRPKLFIIDPLEIFQELFKEAGYEDSRISDKGGFASSTIDKFGSLDDVGDFLVIDNNRHLLETFLLTKSTKYSGSGEVVWANGRAYIDFLAIQKDILSEGAAINLIDTFIKKGIFYRGTILRCNRCKAADWFGLGEIDQYFVCKRCGLSQPIQQYNWKQGKEPTWYYKLDEVVYQGVKNNMQVPLLTLNYFRKKSKKSFLFTTEIELRKNILDNKSKREIDICCIKDGLVILGECKKTKITKEAIDSLIQLSKEFLRYPDMLIFSSLENDLSPEIIEYASKKTKIPIQFLKRADLVLI